MKFSASVDFRSKRHRWRSTFELLQASFRERPGTLYVQTLLQNGRSIKYQKVKYYWLFYYSVFHKLKFQSKEIMSKISKLFCKILEIKQNLLHHSVFYVSEQRPSLLEMAKDQTGNSGVSLYSRKVLIQHKAAHVVPKWMRFLRGVIDSEDIPLNISRELLQNNQLIAKLRETVTSRVVRFVWNWLWNSSF